MLHYHEWEKMSSALIYRVYQGWWVMSRGVGLPRRLGWVGGVYRVEVGPKVIKSR